MPPRRRRADTPPETHVPDLISAPGRHQLSSGSTWSSPGSDELQTPHRQSPVRQHYGRELLPKLRIHEPLGRPSRSSPPPAAKRAKTTKRQALACIQADGLRQKTASSLNIPRSCTAPPESTAIVSPHSAASHVSFFSNSVDCVSAAASPSSLVIPTTTSHYNNDYARSHSLRAPEEESPSYYTSALAAISPAFQFPPAALSPHVTSTVPSLDALPLSDSQSISSPNLPLTPVELPPEQRCEVGTESTVTPLEYLQSPNPTVALVRNSSQVLLRGTRQHFWWDIRNLRPWSTFNLKTIMEVSSFPDLLNVPVNASAFPQPHVPAHRLRPDTEGALLTMIRDHYVAKINAAMKVTQGADHHLRMQVNSDRNGPSLVSTYNDAVFKREGSLHSPGCHPGPTRVGGAANARVVGLVRTRSRWNSAMRHEKGINQIIYLEGLAQLHGLMREHGCRYGFIISETELVCVRAGTSLQPYFGLLDITASIDLRAHGAPDYDAISSNAAGDSASRHGTQRRASTPQNAQDGMTACLALWFLHMLAKDQPLPGHPSWRLDIGAPADLSRQRVLPQKDSWIPQPQTMEKRDARRMRGWILPTDPWNKKREGGRAVKKR